MVVRAAAAEIDQEALKDVSRAQLYKLSKPQLVQEVERLKFTVKHRGYTIGQLYGALQQCLGQIPPERTLPVAPLMTMEQLRSALQAFPRPASSLPATLEFSCLICYEKYDRESRLPVAIPCGHVCCLECIAQAFAASPSLAKQCPKCHAEFRDLLPLFF